MNTTSNDPAEWIKAALEKPGPDGRNMGQLIVARAVKDALGGSHKCRDWLFNRAYGRPAQQLEITNGDTADVRSMILAALSTPPTVVASEPKVLTPAISPPWEDPADE